MRTRSSELTLATLVPRDVFGALADLGIDAEQAGDEAKALCPNPEHDDRSPSWSCNLDTGMHHCFACGFGGSFPFLVGRMLGLTRGDAESWVRERKIKDAADGFLVREARPAPRAPDVSEADMWPFIEPPAGALASRGLTAEACRAYGVRWDGKHDAWITAVRDKHAKLLGWQEKGQSGRYFCNRPKHLVKSGSLFGWGRVNPGDTVLLVESPLDCPYTLPACPGGVVPVSSFGASVSADQIAIIRRRAARVIIAMDNDDAGWKSVAKLAYGFGPTPALVLRYPGCAAANPAGPVDIARGDGRDPGNLTMDEVRYGIENAIPAWRIRIPWL